MSRSDLIALLYIVAFVLFIGGLRMLRGPRTAVRGNEVAAVGMGIAVVATLLDPRIGDWALIVLGVGIGTAVGIPAARSVKMTAMPQMVALFNGVGGGAAALISVVEFHGVWANIGDVGVERAISTVFSALVGSVSFSGSMVAFAKLQELLSGRPITYPASSGNQRATAATPSTHSTPPDTTANCGVVSAATTAASISPIRGPLVTTRMWIPNSLPRRCSGVATWRIVVRKIALITSAQPASFAKLSKSAYVAVRRTPSRSSTNGEP